MQKDVLSLAKKLIILPSVVENKKAIEEVLEVARVALGDGYLIREFECGGFPSILVSNTTKPTKRFKIILNAHLDVVPGTPKQYKPVERDGKLYARGAYDMKIAAAAMLLVFKEVAKKVTYPLALQIVTDEEVGGFHGTKYQIDKGVRGDFVIVGENTDLKINNEAKGVFRVKVVTRGKAAHGAYPWLGENAILKLHKEIHSLMETFPIPTEASWRTTINVARVETTNVAHNKVPDHAEAYLDIRYTPEDKIRVKERIKQSVHDDTLVEIFVEDSHQFTSGENPFIKLLGKHIKQVTGEKSELLALHGSSDARFYEELSIPTVCFGLKGFGHHSDEEWADIKSIGDYVNILKNFLLELK